MITSRICECPECGGVMKSVWSDGKTRIHALTCQRCGHKVERHKNKLHYIEARHFDPLEALDIEGASYEEFVIAFEDKRLEATNRAFSDPSGATWHAVMVRNNNDGSFTVSAYDTFAEEGEGLGENETLPYGRPDVSWTAESVYVNDSKLCIVHTNESVWTYFTYVSNVSVEDEGAGDYIRIAV